MLDQKFGKKEHKLLKKIVIRFLKPYFSANQLTLIGLLFGIVSALLNIMITFLNLEIKFFSGGSGWELGDRILLFSTIFLCLSFIFDVFDGILARIEGPTKYGGILDIFCDRTVEIILILSIIVFDINKLSFPGSVALGSIILCITIFLLIGTKSEEELEEMNEKKKIIYYAGGLIERTETFIFIFLMLILIELRIYLLYLFAVLVLFTALQRFKQARFLFK